MSSDANKRTVPSILVVGDLIAVGLLGVTAVMVVTVLHPTGTLLRTVLGLPFLLFAPGYVLVAALFPGRTASVDDVDDRSAALRDITGAERIVLSFGLSVAISAGVGLVLSISPMGIGPTSVAFSVGGFTLGMGVVAAFRRYSLPPAERFFVPYWQWEDTARTLFRGQSRTGLLLNSALILGIVLAIGSVGALFVVEGPTETFTEFYLLTENENGKLVADEYPDEFVLGESQPVVVGITNHAGQGMNYTVVVLQQRVRSRNNTTTVLETNRLGRFDLHVATNETEFTRYSIEPTATGRNLRIVFLLYGGGVPPKPTTGNADQMVHLDVNVSAPGEQRHQPPTGIFIH